MTNENIDDGGPAFPVESFTTKHGMFIRGADGMSLRDWFAGQALAGITTDPNSLGHSLKVAAICYDLADEMLKARKAQHDSP